MYVRSWVFLAKDEDVEVVLDGKMVPPPMRCAANDEVAVTVTGRDFPGLRVLFAWGHDSRGVGQGAPIDAGADTHRERLRNVVNRLVGLVDEFDLKDERVLGIES